MQCVKQLNQYLTLKKITIRRIKMSLNNVKLFYERLLADPAFNAQIQNVASKEECSKLVKAEGYHFTEQEFEDYTSQVLEIGSAEPGIQSLNERELEAVIGGIGRAFPPREILPMYGVVPPRIESM
jgi:predicted ribosomally synthesized peptide with nif11-like leader